MNDLELALTHQRNEQADEAAGLFVQLMEARRENEMLRAIATQPAEPNIVANGATSIGLRKAIAKVLAGQRARLLVYGNSTEVGAGAGANAGVIYLEGARPKNWPSQLATLLTAQGIPAYNEAIMGEQAISTSGSTYPVYDTRLAVSGFTHSAVGAVGRSWKSTASGSTWAFTPTMTFDRFDVYTLTDTGYGAINADVDGGAATAISNNAALSVKKTTVSCTRGTHTINLVTTSTSDTYIVGVVPWDSTVGGLDIIQAGWVGGKIDNFAGTSVWYPANAAFLTSIGADVAWVELTINDANQSTSGATYAAYLATLAGALATSGAEVLLSNGIPSSTAESVGTLDAINSALASYAGSNGLVYFDQRARLVNYATANANGWMADTVHGNAKLYADKARWVAKFIVSK